MNRENQIDWNKPLQTTTGLPVRYVRNRYTHPRIGDALCRISERPDLLAGGPKFPHVVFVEGKFETATESGCTEGESYFEIVNGSSALDFTKPVQTRGGEKVRVICVNADGPFPVVGYIVPVTSVFGAQPKTWTLEGKYTPSGEASECDLVQAPPPSKWLNVYRPRDGHCTEFATKEEADKAAAPYRLGCIEIPE